MTAIRKISADTILAVTRRLRIVALEQEVARLKAELAAANATIDKLIQGGLAEDRAADSFIDNLLGQVETLQRDSDAQDADIGNMFHVLDEKDEHIDKLEMALLRSPPIQRQ